MKVSEVIKVLSERYEPDDELLIMWWDKEWVETVADGKTDDDEIRYLDDYLNESELIGERIWDFIAHTIDFYRTEVLEQGRCDTCGDPYDLASRDGRCGDCGDCGVCCDHETPKE